MRRLFMINYDEIIQLHIELSTICNARCPLCPRNLQGFPHNLGYNETSLTLEFFQTRLDIDFIKQLRKILINGNFGDFTANLESLDILRHFRDHNSILEIEVSTNGSARNVQFWQELAAIKTKTSFCLDGMVDTHKLYRQDTDWDKIISNAQAYIAAGGFAIWKMILFDHNKHQVDECRELSKQLGFHQFDLIDHGRNQVEVFNRNGEFSHLIGNAPIRFNKAKQALDFVSNSTFTNPTHFDTLNPPRCEAKEHKSVYISADGRLYPCCYLGLSPETYRKGWIGYSNKFVVQHIYNNNLHEADLKSCIEWFSNIEKTWDKTSYESGRLAQCDFACGKCRNK